MKVGLKEEDRDATRFLWPSNPLDLQSECKTYRFTSVLFGATCSQWLLNATISCHLATLEDTEVKQKLSRGLYIDNLIGNGSTPEELQQDCHRAQRIFSKANLFLREWITNCNKLEPVYVNNREIKRDGESKILGMKWLIQNDLMTYPVHLMEPEKGTKREALSIIASIFDPLGLLQPVMIKSRRFI